MLFKRDWESFVRVEVNEDLNEYVDSLIQRHPLRGFDAIHLASAKVMHDSLPGNLIFLCFDQRLASAAHEEGLNTLSPGISSFFVLIKGSQVQRMRKG